MGTAVFPYADIKVFLNARPEVRAQRRLDEMMAKMPEEAKGLDHDKILKDLMRRDDIDSTRELAPLRCPEDALQIDTSNLSIDEVVKLILKHVKKARKEMLRPGFLQHHMAFFYRFILFIAWLIFKIFYRIKAYGLEHFYRGPGIIASNHVSYFDPEILAVCWPEEVHFLAKRPLFENPIFGWFIRSLNAHPITGEPGDITVFKEILELLKQRKKIILFPEGSRAETDELAPLKPGIGLLIMRSQSAVIPAYIHGALKVWPPTQKLPKLFGKIVCVFGTPLRYEHFSHLDKKEAQKAITEALEKSILALKKWYLDGAKGTPP
jgi:1-acyl-sn-glycerol-3-phosphate acyltransferase